jgi:hypothetical protein
MLKEAKCVVGRKITEVTTEDFGGFDVLIFHLDDGTALYATSDEEGNGPAAVFLNEKKGYSLLVDEMPKKRDWFVK